MTRNTLSTQQVAALLNVTETTVKRWADEGKIACMKTPGGHRKFMTRDLIKFAEEHEYKLNGVLSPPVRTEESELLQFAVQTQNYARVSDLLYQYALVGAGHKVCDLFSYLIRHHVAFGTIIDEVMRPALYRIGKQWMEGLLEVNQEHIASQTIRDSLALVQGEIYRRPSNGLTVACACGEGELHELGLRAITYLFETEGWGTTFLGANTPYGSLEAYVKLHKPNLLLLSLVNGPDTTIENIRSCANTVRAEGGKILIGGPWAAGHTAHDLGVDAIGSSATDAIEIAKDLFRLRPGPKVKSPDGLVSQL